MNSIRVHTCPCYTNYWLCNTKTYDGQIKKVQFIDFFFSVYDGQIKKVQFIDFFFSVASSWTGCSKVDDLIPNPSPNPNATVTQTLTFSYNFVVLSLFHLLFYHVLSISLFYWMNEIITIFTAVYDGKASLGISRKKGILGHNAGRNST